MQNGIPMIPETIEQLQAWYTAHNLPPEEVTRFFIGKDVREPRAFGIYRDGIVVIVYKNKDDGSRAIRYSGLDERFAVNEIYQKLKEEIANQKRANAAIRAPKAPARPLTPAEKRKKKIKSIIIIAIIVIALGAWIKWSAGQPSHGYYSYDNNYYYYYGDDWYYYDYAYGDWYPYAMAYDVSTWDDYYIGNSYSRNWNYGFSDFEMTEYYSHTDTSSNWNSNDGWSSNDTNFSSDWHH